MSPVVAELSVCVAVLGVQPCAVVWLCNGVLAAKPLKLVRVFNGRSSEAILWAGYRYRLHTFFAGELFSRHKLISADFNLTLGLVVTL